MMVDAAITAPPLTIPPPGWGYVMVPMRWMLVQYDNEGKVLWSQGYRTQDDMGKAHGVDSYFINRLHVGRHKHGWSKNAVWNNRKVVKIPLPK